MNVYERISRLAGHVDPHMNYLVRGGVTAWLLRGFGYTSRIPEVRTVYDPSAYHGDGAYVTETLPPQRYGTSGAIGVRLHVPGLGDFSCDYTSGGEWAAPGEHPVNAELSARLDAVFESITAA